MESSNYSSKEYTLQHPNLKRRVREMDIGILILKDGVDMTIQNTNNYDIH